ncbi:MAG: hypothetical protein AB8B55_06360 [Mariniblastus sp.]
MKIWQRVLIVSLIGVLGLAAYGYYRYTAPEIPSSAYQHFRDLDEIELCSVHPFDGKEAVDYGNGNIDGYMIVDIGTTAPKKLIAELLAADKANNTMAAKCFWPHHAIRDPNNHDNYFLICFKCMQVRYSHNGEKGLALISKSAKNLFESKVDELGLERSKETK